MIRNALNAFCANVGIDEALCGYQSREIVVSDGDVVEDIISTSKEYNCDVIILGARSGLVSKNSVGTITRTLLKKISRPPSLLFLQKVMITDRELRKRQIAVPDPKRVGK